MSFFDDEKRHFLIAHRILDEEDDVVLLEPVFLLADAPEDMEVSEVKDLFEKTGSTNEFTDDYSTPAPDKVWREYKVVPEEEWASSRWNPDAEDGLTFAMGNYDISALTSGRGSSRVALYDYLARRVSDEKRITLRLPFGLHVALARVAKDMTLNSFCVKTLADAVGYSDLPEFEAQRRKPGRPKKVQDSE